MTRLWHWVLVLSVCIGWSFGRFMSFSTIEWHFYLGYLTGSLLLLRYIRGFFGPKPIRFTSLFASPSSIIHYAKTISKPTPSGSAGHNPVGSLAVIAMLLLLTVQVTSGLFVESDDFFESAPLAEYVSSDMISQMTWVHRLISDWILIIVGLHLSAILFYLFWKKENLIKPMINGWKWVKRDNQTATKVEHSDTHKVD